MGLRGTVLGANPARWPAWFAPRQVELTGPGAASFDRTLPLTADGTVFAVPTPGHMAGHLSAVVRAPEVTYFLAGDATFNEEILRKRTVEGPAVSIAASLDTLDRIAAFARAEPTVLLPAHDPLAGSASPSGSHSPTDRVELLKRVNHFRRTCNSTYVEFVS